MSTHDHADPERQATEDRFADLAAAASTIGHQEGVWLPGWLDVAGDQLGPLIGPGGAVVLIGYDPQIGVIIGFGHQGRRLDTDAQTDVIASMLEEALARNAQTPTHPDGTTRFEIHP